VHLIDLSIDAHQLLRAIDKFADEEGKTLLHYAGVYGMFCRVDWALHKTTLISHGTQGSRLPRDWRRSPNPRPRNTP
jgi:hypothetical protein